MTTTSAKPAPAPIRSARGRGAMILDDRTCPRCGYSLKGLFSGNPCPECGRPITTRSRRMNEDTLGRAPLTYLGPFITSCFALAISGVLAPFMLFLPLFTFIFEIVKFFALVRATYAQGMNMTVPTIQVFAVNNPVTLGAIIVLAAAVSVWFIAVLVLLRPVPGEKDPKRAIGAPRWLGKSIAITQAFWLALPCAVMLGSWSPTLAYSLAALAATVGSAGLPLLAWHLALIAGWAGDTFLEMRLRATAFSLGLFGVPLFLMIFTGTFKFGAFNLFFIFSGVILFGVLASHASLLWGALSMATMAGWAVENTRQADLRDERMAEKARQQRAAAEIRDRAIPTPFASDERLLAEVLEHHDHPARAADAEPSQPDAPRPGSHLPKIEVTKETRPYDLES